MISRLGRGYEFDVFHQRAVFGADVSPAVENTIVQIQILEEYPPGSLVAKRPEHITKGLSLGQRQGWGKGTIHVGDDVRLADHACRNNSGWKSLM